MHIGFALLTLMPGRMGGSETYVRGLLEQFAAGNGPERVTVLVNKEVAGPYAQLARGPVSLHPIPRYRPGRNAPLRAAAMLGAHLAPAGIAKAVPDGIELLHFPVTVPIPRTRLPEVVTLFDLQHHDLPHFFPAPERWLRRLTYDAAARRAAVVVTTSDYSRSRAIEVLRIPPERVEVAPLGVDHERFHPRPGEGDEEIARTLRLERPFVLYPANLWPHKNHERLVSAFAAVGNPDLELVLTGRTYGRLPKLLDHAGRAGAGARVRHLGYVDQAALPVLYRRARALVFPSLYEGFGGPPLEAMACGCPVASSLRTSLAEVCGDAAVALEPDSIDSIRSAIERVISDELLRTKLREAGLERAGRYTWSASVLRHRAIYARAAATPSPLARS